uniref:hypothetical protein n=1 Tax=Nocardioides sp. TaxID=35761 RepID=UPI00286CB7B0
GLTTVPSELTVTVSGETFTVPVLNAPTPTNAFEDADKTDPLTSERLAWQVSTQGYRTELMGAAARTKGWAGGAIDWPSRTLVLYSSSESPTAEIEAIISRHPDDMAVRWEAVDYSEQELEVAQRALYAAIPGALGGSYLRDFSGVIVRIRQVVLDDPQKVAALRRLAEEATTVPVVFQVGTLAFAG